MSFPLYASRVGGPALVNLIPAPAGGLHINSLILNLEFITSGAAGLTQLITTVRGTVSGTIVWTQVYGFIAAAAGVNNFNLPIPIVGMNCVLPRGDGLEINMVNGANVTQCAWGLNIYGTRMP